MNINELLSKNPVVPLVQADDPDVAIKTSRALAAGGLQVAEVVFRTDRALECLQAVADQKTWQSSCTSQNPSPMC